MDADKENTLRALKDQDLIVTSRWCWWGIHTWTKWKIVRATDVFFQGGNRYRNIIQEKTCVHCNTIARRKVKLHSDA